MTTASASYTVNRTVPVAAGAGLRVASLHRGFWSGANPSAPNGQDVAILEKHPGPGRTS